MYRIPEQLQRELKDFYLPFGGSLDEQNRWVKLAAIIPWKEIEHRYSRQFSVALGAPAKRSRMALGALIIKQRLKVSDEETVEQIRENPYLQFFLGMEGFTTDVPFDASMMVYFRKRFGAKTLNEINALLILEATRETDEDDEPKRPKEKKDPPNQGQLILDASCVPQDIRHPTDLGLVNDARVATEKIIDLLHVARSSDEKKPRTYRECARRDYLRCAKNKRLGLKGFYKGRKKQLQYLSRNLRSIKKLLEEVDLGVLPRGSYRSLLVATEVLRQQAEMQRTKRHSISGRIVSLAQPHVRPIVRGKSGTPVEFGAKISVSVVDGFTYVDRISWEAYNESGDLPGQIESYRSRYGRYPESVHADKIYRTRSNHEYCKARGIRMSGPRLGRPPTDQEIRKAVQRQTREDERKRVEVEGKFGEVKRVYGLDRVRTKRADTSETTIMMAVMVMNLSKILRDLFIFIMRAMRWRRRFRSLGSKSLVIAQITPC
jgi:transposase, IS5 family